MSHNKTTPTVLNCELEIVEILPEILHLTLAIKKVGTMGISLLPIAYCLLISIIPIFGQRDDQMA
jgi:hypothetical protein